MKAEVWKDIPGFEGKLLINEKGDVYSVYKKGLKAKHIDKDGYEIIYTNTKKELRIHRLVAKLFISNPYNKTIVHHIDGNKLNNKVTNLLWVTELEHKALHKSMYKSMSKEFDLKSPFRLPGESYAQFSRRKLNIIK